MLDLEKKILPIYLEDVELPRALQMRLGGVQALFWHEYGSDDEFNKALLAVKMLDSCLTEEGKISRGVKPRDGEKSEAGMVTDPESGADGDNTIKPNRRAEEDGDGQGVESRRHFLKIEAWIVVGLLVGSVVGTAIPNVPHSGDTDASATGATVEDDSDGSSTSDTVTRLERLGDEPVAGMSVRDKLDDYKWDELKQLATAIAKASDGEWLNMARAYNLVGEDGTLQGDEKTLKLNDGTETSVRILGFLHDEIAGGGRAGITFEFADVPAVHRMNEERTNEGGWEKSELREWLNSDFLSRLPSELQSRIEKVGKETNNVEQVESEDDASVVTYTDDRLWLLSPNETYGARSHVLGAEGNQCQLYANKYVTTKNCGFCKKRGAGSRWWLRSPDARDSRGFHYVHDEGVRWSCDAHGSAGVSPEFCF